MNKKALIAIIVCSAVLLVMLTAIVVLESRNSGKDDKHPDGTTETQNLGDGDADNTDTTVSDSKDNTDTTSDSDDRDDTKPSDDKTDTTKPSANGDDLPDDTTAPGTTLIPPGNVDMGVVEGEEDSGIDDEDVQNTTPPQNTKPSDPEQTTPPTQGDNTNPGNSVLGDDFDITKLTYEGFNALNGEQQRAVIELFGSPDDFMVWYKAMEAIYKAEHPDIEIGGDGSVDFGG